MASGGLPYGIRSSTDRLFVVHSIVLCECFAETLTSLLSVTIIADAFNHIGCGNHLEVGRETDAWNGRVF